MFYLKDWFLAKKSEKTDEWGNRIIRFIRMNMQPLISYDEAERGMAYLLNRQSLSYVEDLFQNPTEINLSDKKRVLNHLGQPVTGGDHHKEFMYKEMAGVGFKPLPILEKPFRINIAEMKKMGPVVTVRSNDPTSTEQRKHDKDMLKNRKQIEANLSDIYTKIGTPKVKIDHYEKRFGDKPDNGNTESFDSMGLDDGDPADINQFMQHFHKLKQEIAAQDVIDYCMTDNQVIDKTENWVADIWAKKSVGAACHVSDVTGKIMYDYIAPETIWIYGGGRRKDYNDANSKAYQQKISIKEMLDRFGNSFDFENDWNQLLMAITFAGSAVEFTGIKPSWQGFIAGESYSSKSGASYSLNDFLAFKVTVGYIEWTSQNQETFGEVNKDKEGNFFQNNQPADGQRYATEARFETPTYKAFYLAVSTVDQVMFNFGEMTYQQIEGYSDFNTNFSIITYKEIGDPLAIMAAPFLDIIHEAWFKWKYEIRRAKPRGTDYNYDSLMTIAEDLLSDQELKREGKLQKMLSLMDSSANGLWTFPQGPDGKPMMFTAAQLNPDKPNGLSPEIKAYWEIIVNTMDEMMDVLTGRAPLRSGDPGGSRDSMNNQFKALEYSQNATYYVPDMLTYVYQQLASKTMLYTEDIIQFKDYDTLAFKYLEDAVGEEVLSSINSLGKKALHRYGIFVESLNQSTQRQKLSARIDFALQNGKISNSQALLVEDIKSPTKAFLWLSYFEEKTAKSAQQNALQTQQQAQQGQMQLEQMKQQTEKIKGDYSIQVAQIQADAGKQEHIIGAQKQITTTAMKHTSDVIQIEAEAQADLKRQSQNVDATGKQNTPPPPPVPQMPAGGPSPQQQRPQSGIQESISSAQPVSTSLAPQ